MFLNYMYLFRVHTWNRNCQAFWSLLTIPRKDVQGARVPYNFPCIPTVSGQRPACQYFFFSTLSKETGRVLRDLPAQARPVSSEIYAFKLRNTWFERIYVSFAEPLNLVQLHSHWAHMAGQVFMHNSKLTEQNNMDWPGWERSNLGAYWILIKPPPLRPSAPFQRWTCKPTWN